MSKDTDKKVILILLDGLNSYTAVKYMGFLNHLVESSQASYYTVKAELPAMSRPLYEVLMTGVPCTTSKVVSNGCRHGSFMDNLFSITKDAGLVNGASAYYWMSELYNWYPFDKDRDFIKLDNEDGNIDHGIFYYEDQYPDSHVLSAADFLLEVKDVDFLLIHPMNIDYHGHLYGANSKEYVKTVVNMDAMLSEKIIKWMEEGIDIIITADHGMNDYGLHNGISDEERKVPLFIISERGIKKGDFGDRCISQLEIAPLVCRMLNIEKGENMMENSLIEYE